MSGRIFRVSPPTLMDFSNVKASSTQELILASRIDVTPYNYAGLGVRVHGDYSIAQSGAKIEVFARPDAFTTDDPGADWDYSQVSDLGTVTIPYNLSNIVPFFDGSGWDCSYNGLIHIVVRGTQVATQGAVQAILSVDLVLKEG